MADCAAMSGKPHPYDASCDGADIWCARRRTQWRLPTVTKQTENGVHLQVEGGALVRYLRNGARIGQRWTHRQRRTVESPKKQKCDSTAHECETENAPARSRITVAENVRSEFVQSRQKESRNKREKITQSLV